MRSAIVRGLLSAAVLSLSIGAAFASSPLPRRAHVGIGFAPPAAGESGARLSMVAPGGPGEASGLKAGDRILKVDGKDVPDTAWMMNFVKTSGGGGSWPIVVERGGKNVDLTLTMKELPKESHPNAETVYDHVDVGSHRQRCVITKPAGASGNLPIVFYVQGLDCGSIETPIGNQGLYWNFSDGMAAEGFAMFRMEKSGVGDSEGPPCGSIDFDTELAGYKAGLAKIKGLDWVDTDRIYLFGHSMGGIMAPYVAAEGGVRAIAVYGTSGKTWLEYGALNNRRQVALGGGSLADQEAAARSDIKLQALLNVLKTPLPEIKKAHPDLAESLKGPGSDDSHIFGRHYTFFQQLYDRELAKAWAAVPSKVLVLWGETDFVTDPAEHQLIADMVNEANPGNGVYESVPGLDHFMQRKDDLQTSFQTGFQNQFDPAVMSRAAKWFKET